MTDHDLLDLAKAEELILLKRLKAVRAIIDAYIAGDDSRTPYRPRSDTGLVEWKNGPDTAADAGAISPHTLEVAEWRW